MLTPLTPHSVTTPVNTASRFHSIGGTPPITQATQSIQVFHMPALNILELQITTGSIIWKPTPMKVTHQGVTEPSSNTDSAQIQPVTPVSFTSTTQVRLDTTIHLPASQVQPQVAPVWVPLLQITSVASTANMAPSLTLPQTEMTGTSQGQQWTESQCRKCGTKKHPTT